MEYLTGKDYEGICSGCKQAIDNAHMLIVEGHVGEDYIEDIEGPSMLAYDKGWFCQPDCDIANLTAEVKRLREKLFEAELWVNSNSYTFENDIKELNDYAERMK